MRCGLESIVTVGHPVTLTTTQNLAHGTGGGHARA